MHSTFRKLQKAAKMLIKPSSNPQLLGENINKQTRLSSSQLRQKIAESLPESLG
jgi:hypothetical protein